MELRIYDYYCARTSGCMPPADSNGVHDPWEQSGVVLPRFATDTWYHVRAHYTLTSTTITHDWIEVEPVGAAFARLTPTENNVHRDFFESGKAGEFNDALQLDLNGSDTPYHIYYDNVNCGYNQSNF
jgi:hypothetical protein